MSDVLIRQYTKHVLMCTGPVCTVDGVVSTEMFRLLGEKLDAREHLQIKRSRTHCLVACKAKAPVLVVYPEGVWYRCSTEEVLDRIVTEHLEEGRVVKEHVFYNIGEPDVPPP
jgi:(2Fe-2S) ferredoxin